MTAMARMGTGLLRQAARRVFDPVIGRAARSVLAAPFAPGTDLRLLIHYHPNAICWANIYPFLHYSDVLRRDGGIGIRALPVGHFLEGRRREADIVLIQPWFTEDKDRVSGNLVRYRDRFPGAQIVFVDSFANTDLRFGKYVSPVIDLYLKKALFRDRREFLVPRIGDTNLTEYYMNLYSMEDSPPVDWQVPADLLDRLGLIQNFLMAPHMIQAFQGQEPGLSGRPIDLNSRLATKGTPWYSSMRQHAVRACQDIKGISLTPEGRIPHDQFLGELRASKLCWSPFGYGELCWRDIEAFLTGSVLIKPDMSHLETLPDLYRAGETYLPVNWDFSNLEEVVRMALQDDDLRHRIAGNAFTACKNYIVSEDFPAYVKNSILRPNTRA